MYEAMDTLIVAYYEYEVQHLTVLIMYMPVGALKVRTEPFIGTSSYI